MSGPFYCLFFIRKPCRNLRQPAAVRRGMPPYIEYEYNMNMNWNMNMNCIKKVEKTKKLATNTTIAYERNGPK